MIVRDTEAEAREYAQELVSKLDDDEQNDPRAALDSTSWCRSSGTHRDLADMDGFIEPHLWTGIGRARFCGSACRLCR